ncbi:MAG: hypothetical protein HUJ60_03620 [Bacilli bacterium]|nr:hypothetical protein [Bacilli bacterium]
MRSALKIIFGIEIVLGIVVFLVLFASALDLMIPGNIFALVLEELAKEDPAIAAVKMETITFVVIAVLVLAFIVLLNVFFSKHAITMLNKAKKKSQLIPTMILFFFTLSWIPMLLMAFTPSKYLLSTFPYFE